MKKTVLDNGLRLLTEAMPATRAVSVSFYVGAGSRYEDDPRAGVSHFIEHVCFKGTKKRATPAEICSVIEGVGGALNAGTDKEMTVYWAKVPAPNFVDALDVLSDILLDAVFAPEEIEKERLVITEEINMTLDSPSQRVSMLIDELIWPGHPLGRDIAGSRETVAAITRDMMLGWLDEYYRPDNVVLSVAGAIDEAAAVAAVNAAVGGWRKGGPRTAYAPYTGSRQRPVVIETRDTEQTQLCLALPGPSNTAPDRFSMDVLNVILGEGMSSRLFTEIRDRLGLAYSIHSFAEHFLDTGAMMVYAGVDNRHLDVAVRAILDELDRIKRDIPEEELRKAKELFKGRILLRMEDSRSVAGWSGSQEMLAGRILSVDDVVAQVEAITVDDLKATAERYLEGDELRLAVVGPVKQDAPLEDLLKL